MSFKPSARPLTDEQIKYVLHNCNAEQMIAFVRRIEEPAAQVAFTAKLLALPPTTAAPKPAESMKKPKDANSFVGFRSYYMRIPEFKGVPMKDISRALAVLWKADPNKPLWTLLAKAWSAMRNQIGKVNAPTSEFFLIICPRLNIPCPATYLQLHGWKIEKNEAGTAIAVRDSDIRAPVAASPGFPDTTLSVEDIIAYCQAVGYAQNYVPDDTTSTTFLGRSVQDSRRAARDKRRAKRQSLEHSATVKQLRQDVKHAHEIREANANNIISGEDIDPTESWTSGIC